MAQERVEVPITGKIISLSVTQGDTVNEGEVLCILESMKMENPILSPVGGTVTKINVSPEQAVEAGELIAIIEY